MPGSMSVAFTDCRPPHPASPPLRADSAPPGLPLDNIHNSPTVLLLPLDRLLKPWQHVVAYWLTHGACSLRDHATRAHPAAPGTLWQKSLADAWERLPATLPHLLASPYLCRMFGLSGMLPISMRIALFQASRRALEGAAGRGRLDDAQIQEQLLRVNECLLLPMSEMLEHRLFKDLLAGLYRAGIDSPPALIQAHNPLRL